MRDLIPIGIPTTLTADSVRDLKFSVLAQERSQTQMARKLYHMGMGILCAALYAFVLTREQSLFLLGAFGGTWILLDFIRIRYEPLNAISLKYFSKLMRREELHGMTANSYYIVGLMFVTFFFSKPIAILSVLYLAMGDPIAAIVGTRVGRRRWIGQKSVEGSFANFGVMALVTLLFSVFVMRLPFDSALPFALVGGLISMLAEAAPLPVDDNLTIPVISATLLSLSIAAL